MHWEAYHLPQTVEEALQLLARYDGRARVVGGGTDYFVDDPRGEAPRAVVDVTRIAALRTIENAGGFITIGCGVTHTQIVQSPLVQQHGTALAEACGQIGGPQVRNVATLAGNIAHALPAADGTVSLLALDGEVLVASLDDGRPTTDDERLSSVARRPSSVRQDWLPLASAFLGPGKSAIDSTRQVLAAARFRPTDVNEGSAFARVMRPQGVALPIMGLAARVRVEAGVLIAARVALGPVAPTPFLAAQAEAFLLGKPVNEATIEGAIPVLLGECNPRTSAHRSTAEYRREVIPVLFRQALMRAVERCLNQGELAGRVSELNVR
jgi:CO/xanthine dehydrogenase FAD-binding subunit